MVELAGKPPKDQGEIADQKQRRKLPHRPAHPRAAAATFRAGKYSGHAVGEYDETSIADTFAQSVSNRSHQRPSLKNRYVLLPLPGITGAHLPPPVEWQSIRVDKRHIVRIVHRRSKLSKIPVTVLWKFLTQRFKKISSSLWALPRSQPIENKLVR